jgi:hypothetical protein
VKSMSKMIQRVPANMALGFRENDSGSEIRFGFQSTLYRKNPIWYKVD